MLNRMERTALLVGTVVGMSLLYSIDHIDQSMPPMARQLGGDTTLLEVWLIGIVTGLACAGPAIFVAQWVRGRATPLRFGEWLWLCPLFLYVAALAGSWFISERLPDSFHLLWFGAWILVQGVASQIAIFAAFRANLAWTDRFGCVTCFSVGATIFINLILHPLSI